MVGEYRRWEERVGKGVGEGRAGMDLNIFRPGANPG